MVQFNLLPDIKIEYIKARKTKYLMSFISAVTAAVALFILLFSLFYVYVVQKKSLNDLNSDITKYSKQLKSTENLDKILTVQNQLGTLPSLHESRPAASRLFSYIATVTPQQTSLTKLSLDFEQSTMSIGGTADSLDRVSAYTDALKLTYYRNTAQPKDKIKAFSEVVLSSFSRSDKGANFTITLKFDPVLFDETEKVELLPIAQKSAEPQQSNLTPVSENVFGADN